MGALTVAGVRRWYPSALTAAGAQVATTSTTVEEHLRSMTRSTQTVRERWRGEGADSAEERVARVRAAGERTTTALVTLADVLSSAAGDLAAAKDAVARLVANAQADGFTVSDDGIVWPPTAPLSGVAFGPEAAARQASLNSAAEQHAAMIERALFAAAMADTEWATQIGTAVADLASSAGAPVGEGSLSSAVQDIVDGVVRLPSDPQALHDFWSRLSARDKEALAAAEPGLGNRDGIPAVDRDHLNRRYLLDLRSAEQACYDAVAARHADWASGMTPRAVPHPNPQQSAAYDVYRQWQRDLEESRRLLAGYDEVQRVLAQRPADDSARYLLGIDGTDRAVIATGNPDTASNVATYVPGTGSTLAGIGGGVERADAMIAAAARGDGTTSLVTWFGYRAPPELLDATDVSYAEGGAPELARFQDGLRVTHDGAPSHNVVVGHSYGTTVVGTAASGATPFAADDIVLVASPGANANSVEEFTLRGIATDQNGQHVYATTAAGDPVPLYSGTGDFGPNPDGPFFGSRTFTSDPGAPWDAHSSYWDVGSAGLTNMGLIIAGLGRSVS